MTLKEFNSKWSYIYDQDKYGFKEVWEEPKPDKNGNYQSDCESYAIFLKRNIVEFKDWNYWYCKLNGEGHCVLISPDKTQVIDNIVKSPTDLEKYKRTYKIEGLRKYRWYELLWKFTSAWGILLYLKVFKGDRK